MTYTKTGYTFVELLVVIVIAGVILGGGLIKLNQYNATAKLEEATKDLADYLRLAKNNAVSGQNNGDASMRELMCVKLYVTAVGITGAPLLSNGATGAIGSNFFSKNYQSAGVTVSVSPTASDICFAQYTGKLLLSAGNTTSPVDINYKPVITLTSVEDASQKRTIEITSSGVINER